MVNAQYRHGVQFGGDIQNSHRAELAAAWGAVLYATRTDPGRHWHIFSDSLVVLHGLNRYKKEGFFHPELSSTELAQVLQNLFRKKIVRILSF